MTMVVVSLAPSYVCNNINGNPRGGKEKENEQDHGGNMAKGEKNRTDLLQLEQA